MSIMDSTTQGPNGPEPIPVNRFALFSETLLAGLLVLVLSLPLVSIPAAYAAGIAHLERHLTGRDDSVRGLVGTFRQALPGSWKLGGITAAAIAVVVVNLLLAITGQLPGSTVIFPATLVLAGAAMVVLLRSAAAWHANDGGAAATAAWRQALAAGKADSAGDWSGSLLLVAALIMVVVFVWMLPALFVVVPGTLVLAAASVTVRAATRA